MEEDQSTRRIQTAMILFALEEALGAYVVRTAHLPEAIPKNIQTEIERRMAPNTEMVPVSQLVQETYVKEVIDLAIGVSQERSENDALNRLKRLIETLDVFGIRNAVCHPNRPFPDCFWYRMAAIATDPTIESLRFARVTDALNCALAGKIISPPEGWLQQRVLIPNNIPSSFDHEVTGLIARKVETADLMKRLHNPRHSLLAVVAPGGYGKTALCLEVLRQCSLEPATLTWADEIIYVTAKTENLTIRGIEPVKDPITSIESVRLAISRALSGGLDMSEEQSLPFDVVITQLKDRRLLLCVDNLETLLRDNPLPFEQFVETLPASWRVLVTSRISVNGATVLTLDPIKREGATKLARDYIAVRGVARPSEDVLAQLVDKCECNPLAIRLTIDSYATGTELQNALTQAKGSMVDFAYRGLIDNLSLAAGKILECLFGSNDGLIRPQIGHLIGLDPDEVAESINELIRTSLVTRRNDDVGERYSLSSSVRELLLKSPRDALVRGEVYQRLRDQQKLLSEASEANDPLSEDFVPSDAGDHIRALTLQVRRSIYGRSSQTEQLGDLSKLRRAISFSPDEPVLRRLESFVLEFLNDRYAAIESATSATECTRSDDAAKLRLAELLLGEQQLTEVQEHTGPLIEKGLLEDPTVSLRSKARLLTAHWLTSLWLKRYSELLEATKDWKSADELRPNLAALRVSTLQRMADETAMSDKDRSGAIAELVECLDYTFTRDGYVWVSVREGFHALERMVRLHERAQLNSQDNTRIVEFIDKHLLTMCGADRNYFFGDEPTLALMHAFRKAECDRGNPLSGDRWTELLGAGSVADDEALAAAGYQAARITRVFPLRKFAFARSLDGSRDFYIRQEVTDLKDFKTLQLGRIVSVLPSEDPSEAGHAWPAKHVMCT